MASKVFQGILKKQYQDIACDMMVKHYAFYEELSKVGIVKEEEYVTREATICCSNGTEMFLRKENFLKIAERLLAF